MLVTLLSLICAAQPASAPASAPVVAPRALRPAEKEMLEALGLPTRIGASTDSALAAADKAPIDGSAGLELFAEIISRKGLGEGLHWACWQVRKKYGVSAITLVPKRTNLSAAALAKALGESDLVRQSGFLEEGRIVPRATANSKPLTWHWYSWLGFGIADGRVVVIRTDNRLLPPPATEPPTLPGHEQLAAPASQPAAAPAATRRPLRAEERSLLHALGHSVKVQVYGRPGQTNSAKLSAALERIVQTLKARTLSMGLEDAAQEASTQGVQSFLIWPHKDQVELASRRKSLGPPDSTYQEDYWADEHLSQDPKAGPAIMWHCYSWLQLGVVEGRIKIVRANCDLLPPRDRGERD
ncbi:MAG: hypothetical protein LLG01_18325 [Planctomycetaceae bacterium]|nr:hypothetical protein [Planctomycetaceae bacterium]